MHISIWLFLIEQAGMACVSLATLGACLRLRCRVGHIALASLACAACAALAVRQWLALRLVTLAVLCIGTPALAIPGLPRRLRWRCAIIMALMGLLGAGALRMFAPLSLPGGVIVLMACALLSALPLAAPGPAELPPLTTVDVRSGPYRVMLTALIDSGNLLRDGVSGLPVVVISRRAALQLGRSPDGGLLPGMRLMPVRTVNGTSLMPIFRPDAVSLHIDGRWLGAACIIGVSPEGGEGFQALVPAALLAAHRESTIPTSILEVLP